MNGWRNYDRFDGFRPEQRLVRRPSEGLVSGVCAGLAQYFRISRPGLRILFCIGMVVTGFMPFLILYTILTFALPIQESMGPNDPGSGHFLDSNYQSRENMRLSKEKLLKSLADTELRLNKLESYLISSEYEWERKYRGL